MYGRRLPLFGIRWLALSPVKLFWYLSLREGLYPFEEVDQLRLGIHAGAPRQPRVGAAAVRPVGVAGLRCGGGSRWPNIWGDTDEEGVHPGTISSASVVPLICVISIRVSSSAKSTGWRLSGPLVQLTIATVTDRRHPDRRYAEVFALFRFGL